MFSPVVVYPETFTHVYLFTLLYLLTCICLHRYIYSRVVVYPETFTHV